MEAQAEKLGKSEQGLVIELFRREAVFKKLHVGTVSLALLSGNYVVQNANRTGVSEAATLPSSCKNLLQFVLSILPESGDAYLPIFKFVNSFCTGEPFLSLTDTAFLVQQLKLARFEEEVEEKREGEGAESVKGVAAESSEQVDGSQRARARSDPKTEVQKLFNRLKVGHHESVTQAKKRTPSDGGEGRPTSSSHLSSSSVSEGFLQMNLGLLRELNAGKQLLDFCSSLPVFKTLANEKRNFLSVPSGKGVTSGLATIVERLHQLRCALEAVSILVHLPPSLLDPLTAPKLSVLADLLLNALQAATVATCALASLGTKIPGGVKTTSTGLTAQKGDAGVEPSAAQDITIPELFAHLSSCSPPSVTNFATTRSLTCAITTLALKLYLKLVAVMRDSTRVGANVVQNIHTLMVYHTLSGLLPLLGTTSKEGAEGSRLLGHVKFSVPLVELAYQAVDTARVLFEDLVGEGIDEQSSQGASLTVLSFDVLGSYSCWQCVELLLSHLPLLRTLFTLLLGAFRKAVALASSASQPQASAIKDASATPIKTRTEKQERIVKLLQMSLSEKISEKLAAMNSAGKEEVEEGSERSPSSTSTVSSSGEVEGAYTLYTDDEGSQSNDDEDERGGGQEASLLLPPPSEHPLIPFMASLLLGEPPEMATPTAPAPPPPPPLPPRRRVSEPLLPPRFIPRPQVSTEPRYAEMKTKSGLYISLASAVLKCIWSGVVRNENRNMQKYLHEKLQPEHVSCLAWLIQNVESTLSKGESKSDEVKSKIISNLGEEDLRLFASELMEMMHEMIMNGAINHDLLQGILLHELGLNTRCWPLHVTPTSLSLLGRVLICRLQQHQSEDRKQRSDDDPLAVNIWKGFLHTLEENACSEEDQDEDLDVTYLQLFLFVWHSFTVETRRALLNQCVHAVMRAAQARESGIPLSPLVVCRLLLVFDYLLFQFSEPVEQLTEQVNHNLFSSSLGGLRPSPTVGASSPAPSPGRDVMCYPCEQQLQYCMVLSKPGSSEERKELGADAFPRFYNVRPRQSGKEEEKPKLGVEPAIDEEACKLVLKVKGPEEEEKGYNVLCHSLVVLMGCGMEYSRQGDKLNERVVSACASHQCFSLCMGLLSKLPPCYTVLTSAVDGGGLSLKDPISASLLVHVLHLCVRLRVQQIDTEDIMDTLVESGYSQEESEEVIARVLSVIDSTEHFLAQTTAVLEELIANDDDTTLPLMSIIALDFLLTLVIRAILDDTGQEDKEEEEAEEKEEKEGEDKPEEALSNLKEKEEEEKVEGKGEDKSTEEAFFNKFGRNLIPLVVKVTRKLLKYSHLYTLSVAAPNLSAPSPQLSEIPYPALESLLRLSGKDPLSPKDSKSLFGGHIPEVVKESLKLWNAALLIDATQKQKLCAQSVEDIQIDKCMVTFLDLHFMAFAGTRTFNPSRSLKSTLSSTLNLLFNLFSLKPSESAGMMGEIVPISCDILMEFAHSDLAKLIQSSNKELFSLDCMWYKLAESLQLFILPEMQDCHLLGPLLADLFSLFRSMLDSATDWPVLAQLGVVEPPTTVMDLSLLAALPGTSPTAITESLKFLSHVLQLSEKNPTAPHLVSLSNQISSIAILPATQVTGWLRRLVLGSSADGPSDVSTNCGLLKEVVELLTREECKIDPAVGCLLLSTLLPLGSELTESLSSQDKLLPVFRDYFDTIVLLAGTNREDGHLVLVKAVEQWLPDCIQLLKRKEWEQKEEEQKEGRVNEGEGKRKLGGERNKAAVPAGSLLRYLSHLTSAVQFITNMVKCTEKRNLASDNDNLVQDSDSESEEEDTAAMVATTEEEESHGEESDEESLNSKLCTFTVTQKEFMNQHWYHCHTCKLVDGVGMCSICAKVCHKGHVVTYSKFGSFFCDCGAKEDKSCKALVKRTGPDEQPAGSPVSPVEKTPFSIPAGGRRRGGRGRGRRGRRKERKKRQEREGRQKTKRKLREYTRRSSFPSLPVLKIVQQIDKYKMELRAYLDSSGVAARALEILRTVLPPVISSVDHVTSSGCNVARQAMLDLHQDDKDVEYTDNLMAATLGSQEGAFENVRLNFAGDQGQTMRQLLANNSIRRVAMCALASVKGRRQHLCVNHDKGKLTILQLFPILKQADSNRRKLTLTRLSTTSVPFTVLSMSHNPCNEDFMIICGMKECQLLVLNASGQMTRRVVLHPSVDSGGYIVKSMWIPGSQTEMVIVTDSFVKVYDMRMDLLCPVYYFIVLTGKIKDATVAVTDEGKFLVVMTSTGIMFSQPLIPACSADEGAIYFTIDLPVSHPSIEEVEGQVCDGGASVYYSHTLQMLFFSYCNGRSFVATVNDALTETHKVFAVPLKSNSGSGKGGTVSALVQWTEVQHHPGLVCALSQSTSNPVVLLIKPDQIQVHELKALPNKAKVQGMVAMRQPPSMGELSSQHRTTLIILCEDGSLRIYVANNNANTEYWLQPQFQPTSPLVMLKSRVRKKGPAVRRLEHPKFPIDFFEHCQQLQYNEIEFLGNDILHVYNKQQVKHRLSAGGLYIANTKPGGFSMEISNLMSSTTVMVGVRVLMGCRSLERAPSFIEVFGRTQHVTFPAGACRWVDIPFTREESLQADKTFKITFGPSVDPSGVSFVDCIRVYGKAKDVFGWPEHPPDPLPPVGKTPTATTATTTHSGEEENLDLVSLTSNKPLSLVDRLLCNAFCVLGNHCISVGQEKWPEVEEVVSEATSLLMYSVPFSLQYHFKFLLSSTVGSSELYHQYKDRIQLAHVVQSLATRRDRDHLMEPEYFQYILLMLLTIAKTRPENLKLVALHVTASLLEEEEQEREREKTKEKTEEKGDAEPKEVLEEKEGEEGKEEGKEEGMERSAEGEGEGKDGEGGAAVGGTKSEGGESGGSKKDKSDTSEAGEGGEDGEGGDALKMETERMSAFIDLLNEVFWKLFVRKPSSPAVAPVVNPGFATMDITVAVMTEIMWSFVLQNHELLDTAFKYTIRFLLASDASLCQSSLHVLMRLLKPRKPKKDKGEEEREAVVGVEKEETDHEAPQPPVPLEEEGGIQGVGGEAGETGEGEAVGGEDGDAGETGEGVEAGEPPEVEEQEQEPMEEEGAWPQPPLGQPPMLDLEEAIGNPAEMMAQLLANPEQYMMAMQGLIPDEDAMMNLAIALSLQNEGGGGGGGEGAQALQAALHGLGLPVPVLGQQQPAAEQEGEAEQQQQEELEEAQVVPSAADEVVPPVDQDQQEQLEDSEHPEPEEEPEVQQPKASRSSSSSPSLYSEPPDPDEGPLLLRSWEGVLREGTATPSEAQGGGGRQGEQGGSGGERGGGEGGEVGGGSPEGQQDVSSGPDMVNDSSAEDEPGEDDCTIVENLSQKLDPSSPEHPGEDGGEDEEEEGDPVSRLGALRKKFLAVLLDHVYLIEVAGGMRAICFMQLVVFLTVNLECSRSDCEALVNMLKILIKQLKLDREDVSDVVDRSRKREVHLLYLRFFNILMSRKKLRGEDSKSSYGSHMLWFATARTLLKDSQCMDFCRKILSTIINKQHCLEVVEETPVPGSKLKPPFVNPLDDMSPFFQKQYVKGHANDVFAAYGRLLAEICLVLPCQLRKMSEVTKHLPSPEFNSEWMETLCDYLLKVAQPTGVGRRHIRKLLLHICGSKEKYRLMRDVHALKSFMKTTREICCHGGFDPEQPTGLPVHLPYKAMLTLIEQLKACDEIASSRTSNWQAFCLEQKTTLPYLFQASFLLDEGLAPLILQLIHTALSGVPPKPEEPASSKKDKGERQGKERKLKEGDKGKGKEVEKKEESKESKPMPSMPAADKEACRALVQLFLSFADDHSLTRFIQLFLFQSNSTPLRWKAHALLHCLYLHSPTTEQVHLVELLWKLWPNMPSYGHKASQFVDLLGYFTINTPQVLEKEPLCHSFVERAIALLKQQNEMVATHPNSHVYSQLQSLVDFDGFYLESEPCLVCNDPEVPYSVMKLSSVKSEVRYSPNMILVKLIGSYTISQVILRISDIKRTKMVRTVNVYYSNRTVQNVIELKNKRSMWLMARSCNLNPGQNEVKIDFPLPIAASNVIIEFSDFYDNLQGGSEMLQCPRCQASVPAHPGVCGTCGENVYQCHKCRAINYDEKDPFLCNSCGFSKYAKFEISMEARSCSTVDPIESEEDRQKTLTGISTLLDRADQVYKLLVQHRNELDQILISLASGTVLTSQKVLLTTGDTGVNRGIQLVAQRYCVDCKTTYHELSKIIQGVLALRKELVKYDQKKLEMGPPPVTPSEPSTPAATPTIPSQIRLPTLPTSTSMPTASSPTHHQGRCFGCSSAATEHCITLLRALSLTPQTRRPLVQQNLIQELVEFNLRSGSPLLQREVRKLLCHITRDDAVATAELNEFILSRVCAQITPHRTNPNLASVVRPELLLLSSSLDMEDCCWEQRMRTVVLLFRKAQSHPNPAVMAGVTMPCLKILQALIYPKDPTTSKNKKRPLIEVSSLPQVGGEISSRTSDWLRGDPRMSFESWKQLAHQKAATDIKSMSKVELHHRMLMEKYANIWRTKTKKVTKFRSTLRQASWLRSMLFNPSSQSARRATCTMIASLCQGEARQRQILDLLCSFLDDVSGAGEHAQEFLELLRKLTDDPKWKSYLAMRGVLPRIGALIGKEIDHLLELEEVTLSSDLSQGYALKMLTALLQSFLQVKCIKHHFKGKLVGMVLNGYLSLKRLVIQRTKRIDETQELLLEMLEDLTSGTDQERQEFMAVCVETLNRFRKSDMITPVFVFERLCNIIHPEENDVGDFYLSLEKDPQQEEFLQGRMQGNPYPSTTPGLGPLMRDVKNKICTDCELIALLEDDTGMELLVCNKIISLDLPVKEVYKKIWCAQPNHGECMRVVYRMRGLLGDATEDIVERLDNGKDRDVDEEEDYKMSAVLSKCSGLDAILTRLAHVKDFVQGHQLISAALKLLGFCIKLKVNRQHLLQPHLNTLNIMLGTLDLALHYEEQYASGIGARVAGKVLQVTERIMQETSSAQPVIVRSISQEGIPTEEEGNKLHMLLKHIESPFVQSNPAVREGLMHTIPFLTFGDPRNMTVLLQHFAPYLNFEKFDQESSPENRLYLDCFCVVASGIGSDASGEKLKDLAIEMGLTPSAVTYLNQKVPKKIGSFDSPEWKVCVSQPSLPYVLKMLTGLCRWHTKTQLAMVEVIPELHSLEQVASEEHIGTMAENLMEAMRDNPTCEETIKLARQATREEKKRKAMAMREKELGALGMQVNEKGQVIAKSSLLKEMESDLVEEQGLKCCICLEGYRNQPQKILGVYTYTRKVTLDEFENKPRKTMGYCTVSHFNIVHYDCHTAAIKLARSRDEWESAMLQNANTKCNGLMPLWGPEISDSNFTSSLARHNSYLQECIGLYDQSFHYLAHDIRLLLLRFAYEKSFSAESGGGGPQSNLFLIPYLMHIAIYILNTTRAYQREERNLGAFLEATVDKWVSSSYELDGPLYATVQSLFIHTLAQWEEHRLTFLRRLLILAHTRNNSSSPIKSLPSAEPAEYGVYKPVLIIFGLVDGIQHMLKKSVKATGADLPQGVLDYIRNNDVPTLEGCDKLLVKYQQELLPSESFEEFCDVVGLLGVIENPPGFIAELLASVV